ncbi:MAG: hypothetical protein F6K18_25745 [Okeania sp. SIO2C2]|uniref:hypothetical protein n=1 Tax=Okeania sp. SIO2C2 TaxID=2607787 RepID=UPI0013B5CEF0|nr:hypothetical protein [Okeania sp. SIO2C2]NEP89952.1 hypothetical protein [Okeania sp. SIO2C2]
MTVSIKHKIKFRLREEQKQQVKEMLLPSQPRVHGVDRNICTGKIICSVIQKKWGVELKNSRIYV